MSAAAMQGEGIRSMMIAKRSGRVLSRALQVVAAIALASSPALSMGQTLQQLKKLSMPDLTAVTDAAQRALDSPIDMELTGSDIDAALRQVSRKTGSSIRIDLPTLMGRKVLLSDPAPPRLKGDTLRGALQRLLATPASVQDRPVPISSHEGAIQLDSFRWGPPPRGGAIDQGRWIVEGRVVDEAKNPVPRASVRLYCWAWVMLTTADENGRFFATLPTNGKLEVEAWDEKGERRGWSHVGVESGGIAIRCTPTITLKPPKQASVLVTRGSHPVDGARIVLIGGGFPYDGQLTSSAGESTIQIPADLEVEAIIAWKQGVGLDYVASREFGTTRGSSEPLLSTDQQIKLELSEGPAVRFQIVDQFDRPVNRYPLDPWVLKKPGTGADFNLTHLHSRETQFTNADGMVTFDWLPEWQKEKVNFGGWGSTYSRADVSLTLKEAGSNLQTLRVERWATVRGRVMGMDGKPARDVYVIARGGGFQKKSAHANGIADHEGRFEFAIPAQQSYLFVAISRDGKLISPPEERVVESIDRQIDDVDLYLRPGIRVFGNLGRRKGLREETMPRLRLVGDDLNTRQDVSLKKDGSLTPVRAVDEIQFEADLEGKFEVIVGPGRYEFAPRKSDPGIPFELIEQTEYEIQIPQTP